MQQKSFYDEYIIEGKSPVIGNGHGRNNDRFNKEFRQATAELEKAVACYRWYREQAIINLPETSETNVFEVAGLEFLLIEAKKLSIKRIKEWLGKVRYLKYWGTDEIVEVNKEIEDTILNNLFKAKVSYFRRK